MSITEIKDGQTDDKCKPKMNPLDYFHFIPAALVVLYMIPISLLPGPEKIQYTEALEVQRSVFKVIVLFSYMISAIRLGRRKEFEKVGTVPLRGKTEEVVVYGFDKQSKKIGAKISLSS